MNTPASRADSGFAYTRTQFEHLVDQALTHAKKLGATDAGAEASEGCGLSVSVRKGELETVERNRDKSLGVTVYVGHRRGNASTSDFSPPPLSKRCRLPLTLPASPPKTRWPACPTPPTLPRRRTSPTWTCFTPGL
jgi:predicted Zn-dependent protease